MSGSAVARSHFSHAPPARLEESIMRINLVISAVAVLLAGTSAQSYAAPPRTPEEQRNLDRAVDFYQNVIRAVKPERLKEFVSPKFIEHNPEVDGTLESITHYFEEAKKKYPEGRPPAQIVHAFVEGDLVCLIVVRSIEPDPKDSTKSLARLGMEIVRIKDGKQVEHWDERMRPEDAAAAKPHL
jgi:predicted SnoaL-like aldol condensation-catalyzing enzyme